MLKKFTSALLVTGVLGLSQVAFAAGYTVHDVYEAAAAGHLQEAQTMMQQVLHDHPQSAKAHYVEAELYARTGQLADARRELNTAKRLDPTLGFARQDALEALQARLNSALIGNASASRPGFPWGYLLVGLGLIAVIVMALRALMQRNTVQTAMPYGSGTSYGAYGPGYGPPAGGVTGGGLGSGIVGGLATGAAVGAGIVAGEALANRLMDGGHSNERVVTGTVDNQSANDWGNDNLGGNDFGIGDSSSWDDSSGGDMGGDWN